MRSPLIPNDQTPIPEERQRASRGSLSSSSATFSPIRVLGTPSFLPPERQTTPTAKVPKEQADTSPVHSSTNDLQAAAAAVYSGKVAGVYVGDVAVAARQWTLSSQPGYVQSLLSRRNLRICFLPTVGLACLLAEVIGRPPSTPEFEAEESERISSDFWFVLWLLIAALTPQIFDPSCIPDIAAALAAAGHTWRMANRIQGGNAPIASEHLIMFWVVALPLLGGTEWLALAWYMGALFVLRFFTGFPGAGAMTAGFVMLIPVLTTELKSARFWDELLRRRLSLEQLLLGTGNAWCNVDLRSGLILRATDELQRFLGIGNVVGFHLTELACTAHDKECLSRLLRSAALAASGMNISDEMDDAHDANMKSAMEPLKITSLRVASFSRGVVAKFVPFDISVADAQIDIWVQSGPLDSNEPRVQLAQREQSVSVREARLIEREKALAVREATAEEMERSLGELHQLYEEGRKAQGQTPLQVALSKRSSVLGDGKLPSISALYNLTWKNPAGTMPTASSPSRLAQSPEQVHQPSQGPWNLI